MPLVRILLINLLNITLCDNVAHRITLHNVYCTVL